MMAATFNGNSAQRSPLTNASNERDLDIFYNEISSLIRRIRKHNVLIMGGDMNTQIDKNENI